MRYAKTTLQFHPNSSMCRTRLDILDQSGKVIEMLKDNRTFSPKGRYSVRMKSKNLPAGTYLIRRIGEWRLVE